MLRLLLGVMAMAPAGAVAGEPTGFDGFEFGTTRSALVADPGFLARCHPDPETETPAGVGSPPSRVTCPAYDVSDIGAMRVTLLFSGEDQLVGYVMYVGQDRENDVRTRIESVYGRPTRRWERGRSIAWLWPSGTEAIWTIYCLGTDGCLIVKATAPEKDATR
jgi:hypothetical protein